MLSLIKLRFRTPDDFLEISFSCNLDDQSSNTEIYLSVIRGGGVIRELP